jgi:hypothetical protein
MGKVEGVWESFVGKVKREEGLRRHMKGDREITGG